jgi:hypothetical protein
MTVRQWKTMDVLKDKDNYIVMEAVKNLGRAALGREVYSTKGVSGHLGNTAV